MKGPKKTSSKKEIVPWGLMKIQSSALTLEAIFGKRYLLMMGHSEILTLNAALSSLGRLRKSTQSL